MGERIAKMIFLWPLAFLLLIPILFFAVIIFKNQLARSLKVAHVPRVKKNVSLKFLIAKYLFFVNLLVAILVVFALARPQGKPEKDVITTDGIDIVVALDVSKSMDAQDLSPNRLEVAKRVAINFVNGRKTDRIGMVVFAEESYVQCPLTLDYQMVKKLIASIQIGLTMQGHATAIGSAMATSINRLRSKNSAAESRIVILITDGENNAGDVDPNTAIEMAKAIGIRFYTIGVGKVRGRGAVNSLLGAFFAGNGAQIDEKLLKKVSSQTGGEYFRATDERTLIEIFKKISKLEKSKLSSGDFNKRSEYYYFFLFPGLLLLLLSVVLENSYLRILP